MRMDTSSIVVEDHEFSRRDTYLGNLNVKRDGVKRGVTELQALEYIKCKRRPIYFIEKYMKIINVDDGLVPFKLHDFQKDMIEMYTKNRFSMSLTARQVGKCETGDTNINIRNTNPKSKLKRFLIWIIKKTNTKSKK